MQKIRNREIYQIRALTSNLNKLYNNLVKLVILILAAVFIYHKLTNNTNLQNFKNLIAELSTFKIVLTLSFVFLLMLVNWIIEALKWKFLIRKVECISLWKAIESVFCGLTIAVFTPNRIGEYGGRVFFLSPRKRLHGVVAMGIGAIGQMVLTNVIGSIALLWFFYRFSSLSSISLTLLVAGVSVYCTFFLVLYFNITWIIRFIIKIKWLKRFKKFFKVFAKYKKKNILKVFAFCSLRFAVFTSQYCIVINMLVPDLSLFPVVMMVFILFFIQSALPSLDLFDVGVRTLTASYFFSYITHQDVAIIAATAFIWLVNLIIPAILGAPFVFKLNFFGSNNRN